MTTSTDEPLAQRRRNADGTRRLLLDAARRHFARDGFGGTTVRDIADDAGVNVALINRYFTSKEGLFEACLTEAVGDLERAVPDDMPLEQIPRAIAARLAGPDAGQNTSRLVILLRSSGDEGADRIRVAILRSFSDRLAEIAGWRPGADADADQHLLLNAQIVLAATFGIAILRASSTLQPLTSAGEEDLFLPISQVVDTLLAAK